MQQTPLRLSQTIWSAFRAARPPRTIHPDKYIRSARCIQTPAGTLAAWAVPRHTSQRLYSTKKDSSDIEEKVADAKDRIHNTLDARAATAAEAESHLRKKHDETIVHANPESSSIVHKINDSTNFQSTPPEKTVTPKKQSALPSQKADVRSRFTTQFSHFMDNFQSQIFAASQRLNDLTGYTGIERLKREIDAQESSVQSARQAVKDSRAAYAEAIAMRSATQREVNDLLQRKHAWSPQDLERFTNLYRSDHANEQSEQKAHQALSDAEVRYEEASTKLAKSILARYHEEQIWSDKIRQMSTWGTWGLMGLNVLLFVVLQLAIEPWRRRRLVRGFEEKVEVALASREQENQELRAQLRDRSGGAVVSEAVANKPEPIVVAAGEQLAEVIVDAITGSSGNSTTNTATNPAEIDVVETAVEQITTDEIRKEDETAQKLEQITQTVTAEGGSLDIPLIEEISTSSSSTSQTSSWSTFPASIYAAAARSCTRSYDTLLLQFDTSDYIVLSRRQMTVKILESLAAGAALAGGVMFVMARNR